MSNTKSIAKVQKEISSITTEMERSDFRGILEENDKGYHDAAYRLLVTANTLLGLASHDEKAQSNEMEPYAPALEKAYIIESDGDSWFAHHDDFTNVQESDEVAFGKTPQEALQKLIELSA